ncbi:hypothetical protein GCM10011579_070940 [Streptomyces albiflavescens]|uniref:Uncharacterized protein n=1 Tax=Streptomyces albiflavescens TaxID=1623582 RepID=A0A918D8Y0_9ACTN|nr:hypothetical protein GCM10011579_070940 [Streptomyces albiflavescens]
MVSALSGETTNTLVGPPAIADGAPNSTAAKATANAPVTVSSSRSLRIRTPNQPVDPRAARPHAVCHFWYTARPAGVPTRHRPKSRLPSFIRSASGFSPVVKRIS